MAEEPVVAGVSARPERANARAAFLFGAFGALAVCWIGGLLQSWNLVLGLAATLWGLLLGLAVWAASDLARRGRTTVAAALGFARPSVVHALGAALLAPAIVLAAQKLFALQQIVLPLPSSIEKADLAPGLADASVALRLALLALSPAICEELFFRGAILNGLKRELPAWKAVAVQALLFAAMHGSIHRLAPTCLLGLVLGAIALQSRGVFPGMLLHAVYNAAIVVVDEVPLLGDPRLAWLALLSAPLFFARARRAT